MKTVPSTSKMLTLEEYSVKLKESLNDSEVEKSKNQDNGKGAKLKLRGKRRGPYGYISKLKAQELYEYYFIDKMTVREACELLKVNERTAYAYIRKLKVANMSSLFDQELGYTRDQLVEALRIQMGALNLRDI